MTNKQMTQEQWITQVGQEVIDLLLRKNADYGSSFSKQYERYGLLSGVIRMDDKMQRLGNLISGHKAMVDESIDDTIMDLCGYALLTLVERRKEQERNNEEEAFGN